MPLTDLRYSASTRGGGVDVNFDGFPDYIALPNGGFAPYVTGTVIPGGYEQGGSATPVADYGNDLLPRIRRDVINLLGHYDVSPALTFFAEGKFARNKSFSLAQPSFDYYLYLFGDNPYIPPVSKRPLPTVTYSSIATTSISGSEAKTSCARPIAASSELAGILAATPITR